MLILRDWIRQLRGAAGLGLTWALCWAPIGALVGTMLWFILDPGLSLQRVVENQTLLFGLGGLLGGTLFSAALRLAHGRRRFDELTVPRLAVLGAVGGLVVGAFAGWSGLWGSVGWSLLAATTAGVGALIGAVSAAGTLVLARLGDDRALLDAASDVAAVGLTDKEAETLLGS